MAGDDDTPPPPASTSTTTVMSSCLGIPGLEKLTGPNDYENWRFGMQMALIEYGLWGAVEGTDTDPLKCQRSLPKIYFSISPSCQTLVKECKTGKEAWDVLVKAYKPTGLLRQISLKRKLYRVQKNDFPSMSEYIGGILDIVQQLSDLGVKIDQSEVGILLLCGLPDGEEHIIHGYCSVNKEIKKDEVVNFLNDLDSRKAFRSEGSSGSSVALYTNGEKKTENKEKFVPTCHECNKKGHIRPKCPKFKSKKKEEKKAKSTGPTLLFTANHAMALDSLDPNSMYMDSCASNHVSSRNDWMDKYNDGVVTKFKTADNGTLSCEGVGNIPVNLLNSHNGCTEMASITDVKYSPNAAANLLSVYQIAKKGHIIVFNQNGFNVYGADDISISGPVKFTGSQVGGIYKLDQPKTEASNHSDNLFVSKVFSCAASSKPVSAELIHRRLAHVSSNAVTALKDMTTGLKIKSGDVFDDKLCVPCAEGKLKKKNFPKGQAKKTEQKLELIHMDLCGPMRKPSWGGARYAFLLTDDFSRKTFVYFLKEKSMKETFDKFVEFKVLVENQLDLKIKRVRSDNGTEFCNVLFNNLFTECGIVHETTNPHTPQQNGVQERCNRTCVDKADCMLSEANLDRRYWAEALNTAVYIKNRSPTAALKGNVPEGVWTDSVIDVSNLRVFGCVAFKHIPKQFRGKFEVKSEPLMMIGYYDHPSHYKLVDPKNPKHPVKARDVVFFENIMFTNVSEVMPKIKENCFDMTSNEGEITTIEVVTPNVNEIPQIENNDVVIVEDEPEPEADDDSDSENNSDSSVSEDDDNVPEGRPVRNRRVPEYLNDYEVNFLTVMGDAITVKQALSGPNADKWKEAMDSEYNQLVDNNVWELVDRPEGTNIVKSKWVFRVKENSNNLPNIYKARLVAKGFSQQQGVDYNETFAPVARLESIRLILALAVQLDLPVEHIDVKAAFLHSELDETIYMEQPQGYEKNNGKVWRLKRAIYGLKQASRAWNLKVQSVLVEAGYTQAKYDQCVFVKKDKDCLSILSLYVDDFLLVCNSVSERKRIIKILKSAFKIKLLGEVSDFLGIKVVRNKSDGSLFLSQKNYIDKLAIQYGIGDANLKNFNTPMELNVDWHAVKPCKDCNHPYQTLIGALMYLTVCTRPDIAHSVAVLCKFNNCHGPEHWHAAKRIVKYLSVTNRLSIKYTKGTTDLKLYSKAVINCKTKDGIKAMMYADADWAGDTKDRISYSGYVFVLAGGAIGWQSHKQKSVSTSSRNAEFMSMDDAVKELLFIKGLLNEIIESKDPIVLYSDSQSAIKSLNRGSLDHKNKYIEVRFNEIMQECKTGNVIVKYKCSEDMIADVLTKSLGRVAHERCLEGLGISSI